MRITIKEIFLIGCCLMVKVVIGLENTICQLDKYIVQCYKHEYPDIQNISLEKRTHVDLLECYKNLGKQAYKRAKIVFENFGENGKFKFVEPYPNALHALHKMREFGVNVKILTSHNTIPVQDKLDWVAKNLGKDWISHVVVLNDKSLLNVDFLIDCIAPNLSSDTPWKLILFDQPYNKDINCFRRLNDWKEWKAALGLGNEEKQIPKFRHGSEDSKDEDVFYLFDKKPSHKECLQFCSGSSEDRNIIVVENGVVVDAFRGQIDEVNNGLLMTYGSHKQDFPNPVKFAVHRVVPVKVAETIKEM